MGLLTSKRAASLLAAGASVLALGAMSDSASAACANITGQGATFQAAAQNIWAGNFTCLPAPGATVTYTGTGSGAGLRAFGVGGATPTSDAFIGTDDAPNATQVGDITTAASRNVRVFPVVQAAVAVLSHLPDTCTANTGLTSLRADNQALQDVYDGSRAVTFNDLYPSQLTGAGCTGNPRPYARNGTSGTTQIFKQFLSLTAGWGGNTSGDNVWPVAAGVSITATSGGNIADLVNANPGTVGYAVLADAAGRGFTADPENDGLNANDGFWALVNNNGTWQNPQVTVLGRNRSNCANATYTGAPAGTRDADWSSTFGVSITGSGYGICGLTYVVAYEGDYGTVRNAGTRGLTTNSGDTANQYFVHVTSTTGQALVNANNYAPLTGTLLALAQAGAAGVAR